MPFAFENISIKEETFSNLYKLRVDTSSLQTTIIIPVSLEIREHAVNQKLVKDMLQ